jgi:predicted AAA+ superfamily ATPase
MNYKRRYLHGFFETPPRHFRSILICGPRRSGKSTIAKEILNDWGGGTYISFDTPSEQARFAADPEGFLRSLKTPLVLDEVQNVPQVFNYLKKIIDEKPDAPCEYILTGSQQFQMMRHVSESLAGRILIKELLPFCSAESRQISPQIKEHNVSVLLSGERSFIYDDEPLNKSEILNKIIIGGYPQVTELSSIDDCADWFNSYLETYIQRDVRALSNVKDLMIFSRFVSLIAGRSANIINYSQIGKDIQVNYKTSQHYISLLEASYLWKSILPCFKAGSDKRLSKRPKGMFLDTGLALFLSGVSPNGLEKSPSYGSIFETFVFLEFYKLFLSFSKRVNFLHFRAGETNEVDLILEYEGRFIPVEVKVSGTPSQDWGKGIKAFRNIFKKESSELAYVISFSSKEFSLPENIKVLPIHLFL